MKPGVKLIVCLLSLALLSSAVVTASALTLPTSEFETIMIGETKVILQPTDKYGDQASIFAVMLAGHGQQQPNEAHCAHVAEHTVFRNPVEGKMPLGEWALSVNNSNTPSWLLYNGWTGVDHTQFEITVPGEHIPEALERLLAGLFPEDIDKTAYEKEMTSRLQSELKYMTTDEVAAPFHTFNEHLYQGTPYCQNIFSVPVTQVSPDLVLDFMTREYSSSRLVITIVGSFNRDRTLTTLEDVISNIPIEPRPVLPKVQLNPPPVAAIELASAKRPLLMLGIGTDAAAEADASLLTAAMRVTLSRLAGQPPVGFTTSPSLLSLLPTGRTHGLLMTFEANSRITPEQLADEAATLTQLAKEIVHDLATSGPTSEEVAPMLVEVDLEAGYPESTPKTLIAAFMRGRLEIPGMTDLPAGDMTEASLASDLQQVLARHEASLQYTVLAVTPTKTPLLPVAIAGALALLAITAFALLRRRNTKRKTS